MAPYAAIDVPTKIEEAESCLHCGAVDQARDVASRVLSSAATPTEVTRAFYVVLQVDFQEEK